jgi:hypothetical protein
MVFGLGNKNGVGMAAAVLGHPILTWKSQEGQGTTSQGSRRLGSCLFSNDW